MKKIVFCSFIYLLLGLLTTVAQHKTSIKAVLNVTEHTIEVEQRITYHNTSKNALSEIFIQDWANAFSNKRTPLGERFAEDYSRRFYFAKDEERGATTIHKISNENNDINWNRIDDHPDVLKLELPSPIASNEIQEFTFQYTVKLPSSKFTRFGYKRDGDYDLRYWYLTPVVYDSSWQIYSHKNLNDQYVPLTDYEISFTIPTAYKITSELQQNQDELADDQELYEVRLSGKQRNHAKLFIEKKNTFLSFPINDELTLVSNIDDNDLMPKMKSIANKRIFEFLEERLGKYPFDKLVSSDTDYQINPVYGLNQLPDIVRPFPDGFQYEIKQLKAITDAYLRNTLIVNPRKDAWIRDAIHVFLMMEYTNKYYYDTKLIGNLSKIIGIRWFHAADLKFNDQYYLGYKNMARRFLDQPLTTPQDSLVKFNKNIANPYKAGVGLRYLEDYLGDDNILTESIQDFYKQVVLKPTKSEAYEQLLEKKTSKDISWFFDDFIRSNKTLDFKIKKVKKKGDSLEVIIKNKKENAMPISLYGFRKDKGLAYKAWLPTTKGTKKYTIPNDGIKKLMLDADKKVPEVNRRNNHKKINSLFNKPFQFRLLQDVEDPDYSQIFFTPEFEFNVYDGLTIGNKFYNKSVIKKNLDYRIVPSYGFLSKKLLGSVATTYTQQVADDGLYSIKYGISGSMFSYAPDLLFRRYSPYVLFYFRNKDLRNNENSRLTIRTVGVSRERDEINPVSTPDYDVFNVRYRYTNPNLINLFSYNIDYQLSQNFSKLSTTLHYRKLFLNNRQVNLRFFAGTFLFNDTQRDGDFFSFALDRPTDYLFDYSYLGRSEEAGLVSQQIILAEGGFKSQLEYPFANRWITTLNAETNIWNWIYAYGDVGFVKNKGINPKFVYDAGVRLSLVADYFELFFPVVSNNGWEISQPNYDEKIRFIITLNPQTLIGLFTRRWY